MHFELNPADIIKEEDYEESVEGMSFRKSSRMTMAEQTKSGSKMSVRKSIDR